MPQQVLVDPPRRVSRKVYRRRRIVVFGTLIAILVAFVYVVGSLVAPVPATAAVTAHGKQLVQPAVQLAWPGYGSAAIVAPDYPGASASHGSDASVPIASITKTITALVVLEKKPLNGNDQGPDISFTQRDVDIWNDVVAAGGSWAPVVAGTSMTEKQALEAMLLPSANNYAISLANWAYGSTSAYVSAANDWLAKNGFTGTKITTPDGLDPGNVSTTKDLIGIGKLVLASPALSSIVSQKNANLPGAGSQDNTNTLLGFEGMDGIKTGNTDEAGNCLLFSAELPVGSTKVRVLGVVLGAPTHDDLWAGVQALMTSMKSGFHQVTPVEKGQVFGTYTTAWGASSKLIATETKSFLVWSDTPITVDLQTRPLSSGFKGDILGQGTFTLNGTTATVPLALARDVPDPGFGWRLAHPGGLGA
ncbi:D-alanyl-D-alanine carboxypeptidase [Leifsonia sp. 1010]|uniref:D-alanyl-D-alanine carboxypeptidase family protein n=1 Tax=Leifsonia sp. 1010 TaxID=2817769 RepID=UPI00286648D3|nr:D-alanyl-D-alanine carboxypeptidase [Leifsonia sp. 1010]MDR6613390.1 D-alanyl-D-alanine carboxypeptidase (penicillin-binding protein 5/6) [Leifsonia sp. 1010]